MYNVKYGINKKEYMIILSIFCTTSIIQYKASVKTVNIITINYACYIHDYRLKGTKNNSIQEYIQAGTVIRNITINQK